MVNNKKKYIKKIELFHEKSGRVVRVIKFKKPKDFDYFLNGYKSMRYPGYNWRDCKKNGKKRRYCEEKSKKRKRGNKNN